MSKSAAAIVVCVVLLVSSGAIGFYVALATNTDEQAAANFVEDADLQEEKLHLVPAPPSSSSTDNAITVPPSVSDAEQDSLIQDISKYDGATLVEMRRHHAQIDKLANDHADRLAAEHRERGEFDVKIVPEGTTVRLPSALPDGSPVLTNVRTTSDRPGFVRLEIVSLRPRDYPELSSLCEERDWLAGEIRRLESKQ